MRELSHWLGLDNAGSPQYLFFSGVGFSVFAPLAYLWHHNCHTSGCLRIGHTYDGIVYCKNHHPANVNRSKS